MLNGHAKGEAFDQNEPSERAKWSRVVLRRKLSDPSATQGCWIWWKLCLNYRSRISNLLLLLRIKMHPVDNNCTWHIEIFQPLQMLYQVSNSLCSGLSA